MYKTMDFYWPPLPPRANAWRMKLVVVTLLLLPALDSDPRSPLLSDSDDMPDARTGREDGSDVAC